MAYLLDTTILSELRRNTCNPGVAAWMTRIEPDEAYLSVLTTGEIRRGIELHRAKDAKAAGALELVARLGVPLRGSSDPHHPFNRRPMGPVVAV